MQTDHQVFNHLGAGSCEHPVSRINDATHRAIGRFRGSRAVAQKLKDSAEDFVPFYMDTICILAECLKQEVDVNAE